MYKYRFTCINCFNVNKDKKILKKRWIEKTVELNVIGIVSFKFSCKFCIQWSTYEKYYDFYGDSKGNTYYGDSKLSIWTTRPLRQRHIISTRLAEYSNKSALLV
jgi:hypothetical protein